MPKSKSKHTEALKSGGFKVSLWARTSRSVPKRNPLSRQVTHNCKHWNEFANYFELAAPNLSPPAPLSETERGEQIHPHCRVAIRHHPHPPAWAVRFACSFSKGQDFRRSFSFVSLTEWTGWARVAWSFTTNGGYENAATGERIVTPIWIARHLRRSPRVAGHRARRRAAGRSSDSRAPPDPTTSRPSCHCE